MNEIHGTKILIAGYGKEGKSAHRYIQGHYPEMQISIADQNTIDPLYPVETIYTGKNYLESAYLYDTVIRSPGIAAFDPSLLRAMSSDTHITSCTNIFFSLGLGTVIGITGTKGKSTTTTLIYEIVKASTTDVRLVGNIGKPVLDFLEGANNSTVFVMELSAHQLEDCRYSPHIAVLLNIFPEHLDRFRSFEDYKQAKFHIVGSQSTNDILVTSAHYVSEGEIQSAGKTYYFSSEHDKADCFIQDDHIIARNNATSVPIMKTNEIVLKGKGNVENVLAAVSVGILMTIPPETIKHVVASFKGLDHRLEHVATVDGVDYYDDSIATIPEATINALDALGDNVETLIVGGYDRGLDFSQLGAYLTEHPVKNMILFPTTGEKIWESIPSKHDKKRIDVMTMEEAVKKAREVTSSGNICLLSPASASYNLFTNFEDRGNQFKKEVKKYKEKLEVKS